MVIEAKVRTASRAYSDGTHVSISEAAAYGDTLVEKAIAADMAGKIAEGHAKGHGVAMAIEETTKYKMLPSDERRKLLTNYSNDP